MRDLEQAIVQAVAAFGLEATTIEGLTGVWMPPAGSRGPRKIASIGVRVSRWVTTHGYALNVDLDPAPFTEWITACGLDDAEFTTMARELGRPLTVDEVKPAALAALSRASSASSWSGLPATDGAGLWAQTRAREARRPLTRGAGRGAAGFSRAPGLQAAPTRAADPGIRLQSDTSPSAPVVSLRPCAESHVDGFTLVP